MQEHSHIQEIITSLICNVNPPQSNAALSFPASEQKKRTHNMYRPPKVRPKNLTIGGRYFYG